MEQEAQYATSELIQGLILTKKRSLINCTLTKIGFAKLFVRPIPGYIQGDNYQHPAIINHMVRNGGIPETIIWNQTNTNPDLTVESYMKGIYSALLSDHTRHPREGGDLINLINYFFVVKDSRLRGNDGEFKDFAE
ncbi:hypothetical protein KKA14_14245 [bacterium]|nr:hypothetical protein [bacterium]